MDVNVLIEQHELAAAVLDLNTEGITHEESLCAPREGGNCVNWVVGHLVKARIDALAVLGHPSPIPLDKVSRYAKGKPRLADPAEAVPLDELIGYFHALQQPLTESLRKITPDSLSRPVPNSPTGDPDETIGSFIVAEAFHEAYHLGQSGLLRQTLGKPRPAAMS